MAFFVNRNSFNIYRHITGVRGHKYIDFIGFDVFASKIVYEHTLHLNDDNVKKNKSQRKDWKKKKI